MHSTDLIRNTGNKHARHGMRLAPTKTPFMHIMIIFAQKPIRNAIFSWLNIIFSIAAHISNTKKVIAKRKMLKVIIRMQLFVHFDRQLIVDEV